MSPRFSANLGFLWKDLTLPDAIRQAADAGFEAVECHQPYSVDPLEVVATLDETGLRMVSLNARVGSKVGDFGLAACVGREAEARADIDEAIEYAAAIGCPKVSVHAGVANGSAAESVYVANIRYASSVAGEQGVGIVLEPVSLDGFFLAHVRQGIELLNRIDVANVELMVDCFHVAAVGDDVETALIEALPVLGHIQIAAFPDRGEPDGTGIDYRHLLPAIEALGYGGYVGAEYIPRGDLADGLTWFDAWK